MPFSEFNLIEKYFARPQRAREVDPDIIVGIGDDAALITIPVGMELVVSIDTLVAGVHFLLDTAPTDIGHKVLAVNLSDLAAMGATPRWATLALSLPEIDEAWLSAFSQGFFALAERFGVHLIGGDTTRGPLSVTVQMHGLVAPGQALRRAAAQAGDRIYVTGELGDAGLALRALQGKASLAPDDAPYLLIRLNRPEPRISAGLALSGIAHAAIDISDGLAADLGHILAASRLGATVHLDRLPLSKPVAATVTQSADWSLPLSAGDDYELCFMVPQENEIRLAAVLEQFGCKCTCIGVIEATPGLRWALAGGKLLSYETKGYDHFGCAG